MSDFSLIGRAWVSRLHIDCHPDTAATVQELQAVTGPFCPWLALAAIFHPAEAEVTMILPISSREAGAAIEIDPGNAAGTTVRTVSQNKGLWSITRKWLSSCTTT
jgi:hypothetical protein